MFFLFNPFNEVVLKKVVENIHRSLEANWREIYIFYHAPFHRTVLEQSKYFQPYESSTWHVLYRSAKRENPEANRG